ncbi:stalk domain-containing protein [Thermoanaerobacter thermohydrosulfuricus]
MKKILVLLLAFVIGYLTADYLSNWYEQANGCIFTVGQTKYKEGVMLSSMNIGDILFDLVFNQKYNVRNMNVSPFIKDGEIYIPIRYVFESHHIEYQYDKDKAVLTYKKVVKIDAKTSTVYVKGQAIKTNNPIIIYDNEIFVSAKDLHEIFLANIKIIQNKNNYSLFVN